MQTEEIKIVIEAIKSLSTQGNTAFMWWLAFKTFDTCVNPTACVLVFLTISKTIKWCMNRAIETSKD